MEGRRYVGIDVGKRTMEVRFLSQGSQVTAWNGKTDARGRAKLASMVNPGDTVGIEAGVLGFALAKQLRSKQAEVHVLNPGKLAVIFASTKKTDAEDALKLAQMVKRFEPEELPLVDTPTEEEEKDRALVNELAFLKKLRTQYINRLHAVYVREGLTDVTKANLATVESREETRKRLSSRFLREAERAETFLSQYEENIDEIEREQGERLKANDLTPYLLSIPGVGPNLAMAYLSYLGDGRRFSSAAQVANYTGLVPRVDCSGDTNRYGPITKRGCKAIRRVAVQAAWSLVYAKKSSALKDFYERRSSEIGRKKAIVGVARKLIVLMWTVAKNREYFRGSDLKERLAKLRQHKVYKKEEPGVDAKP